MIDMLAVFVVCVLADLIDVCAALRLAAALI